MAGATQSRQPHGGHGCAELVNLNARHPRAASATMDAAVGAGMPGVPDQGSRLVRIDGVHELALAMPHVKVEHGVGDNPIYR
jgi:hypothetical protein